MKTNIQQNGGIMLDYKDTLRFLSAIPSIAGCEKYAAEKIREKFGELFDEIYTDAARNIILVKKSKKNPENAKTGNGLKPFPA